MSRIVTKSATMGCQDSKCKGKEKSGILTTNGQTATFVCEDGHTTHLEKKSGEYIPVDPYIKPKKRPVLEGVFKWRGYFFK